MGICNLCKEAEGVRAAAPNVSCSLILKDARISAAQIVYDTSTYVNINDIRGFTLDRGFDRGFEANVPPVFVLILG